MFDAQNKFNIPFYYIASSTNSSTVHEMEGLINTKIRIM